MHRKGFGCVMAVAFFLVLPAAARPQASEKPPVRELRGDQLTSDKLIEVLEPQEEAPPEFRARGGGKVAPQCAFFRKQRGNPVAEIAAIQVLFAYDSDVLRPEARQSLDQLGKALTSSRLAPCCFQIEGYTDSEGTPEYNRGLSQRRAESVIDYLASSFSIDRQRLMPVGKGESDPIANNDSEEGRSRNRRVQIVNLGFGQVAQP